MKNKSLRLVWLFVFLGGMLNSSAHAGTFDDWTARPAWPEPISFASGTALTLTALALRHPLGNDFQNYEVKHKPLGKWSKYGDLAGQMIPNALYAGGMAIAAWAGQSGAAPRAQMMVMASTEAVLITTVLKYTIREQRPDSNRRESFPSGHSTSIFAFASVVGAEEGWRWGVPAYALAGFVGWSRINDNAHFLHDILAGATIGISTGLGVYYARERRQNSSGSDTTSWMILPMPVNDGGGLMLEARY